MTHDRTPIVWKSETQVNTADAAAGVGGTNKQYNPQITALQDGGYLVVWVDESRSHNPYDNAILGQRYDLFGQKVGGEVDLSHFAEGANVISIGEPTVTTLGDGAAGEARCCNQGRLSRPRTASMQPLTGG
jgi:hypothetical protein